MSGPVTLADLARDGQRLLLCCDACGRSVSLDPAPFLKRYGATQPVPELGAKFKCSACGCRRGSARPDHGSPKMGVR